MKSETQVATAPPSVINRRKPSGGFIAIALSALLAGCSSEAPPLTQQEVFPVKLVTLDEARAGGIKRYPGRVSASDHSELSFRVNGELRELLVKPGDVVEKDAVVARLDERDARTQLENAQSTFKLAESTFERMRISLKRQAISQARFDEAEAEYLSSKARLDFARDQHSYTVLRAPFTGVISQVPVEVYQVVSAGQPIVEVQRPGSIDVSFQMPEQDIRGIQPGRSRSVRDTQQTLAWVTFPERPEKTYPAAYKEHDSNASNGSLSYEVTVTLPEPTDITVLAGMSAAVLIDYGALTQSTQKAWLVPASALSVRDEAPEETIVWRYLRHEDAEHEESGAVEPVSVEPGLKTSAGILVQGALEVGDRIVVAGTQAMQENLKVRPWIKAGGL